MLPSAGGPDLKLCVGGHLAIDQIQTARFVETSLGGAPCYAGLTARNFGCRVACVTKFGPDLTDQQLVWLGRHQLHFQPGARHPTRPTTRFEIRQTSRGRRSLRLLARCVDLTRVDFEGAAGNALIANPLAGELAVPLLTEAAAHFAFVYLDPQGFLRRFAPDGTVRLGPAPPDLLKVATVVKADMEEAERLIGVANPLAAGRRLKRQGPEVVMITQGRTTLLLFHGDAATRIYVPRLQAQDTTGAGDILGGAFVATYAREREPVWSACVGVAAATLAVAQRGLGKIPPRAEVLELAERLKTEAGRNV